MLVRMIMGEVSEVMVGGKYLVDEGGWLTGEC